MGSPLLRRCGTERGEFLTCDSENPIQQVSFAMSSGRLADRDGSIRNCLRERDSPLMAVSARGRATDGLKDVAIPVSELWDARERCICRQVEVLPDRNFVGEQNIQHR